MKKFSTGKNPNDVCVIGPDGERTVSQEQKRFDKLRSGTIKAMKKAVQDEPDKYDANRLQTAIDKLNEVDDENLDAYLILGKHLSLLMKQIEFSPDEVTKFKNFFNSYGVITESQTEQDDRTRDDWMYKIKGPKCDEVVVWINKSEPMFGDKGYYNILWLGGCLSPYMKNFYEFDKMLEHLKVKIDEYE